MTAAAHGGDDVPVLLHGSLIRSGGRYAASLEGIRVGYPPDLISGLNGFTAEAVARGMAIVVVVRDLGMNYHVQFTPDGRSRKVAPPPPSPQDPLAALKKLDLGAQPDGGADQEEWVADHMLAPDDPDRAPRPRPRASREGGGGKLRGVIGRRGR